MSTKRRIKQAKSWPSGLGQLVGWAGKMLSMKHLNAEIWNSLRDMVSLVTHALSYLSPSVELRPWDDRSNMHWNALLIFGIEITPIGQVATLKKYSSCLTLADCQQKSWIWSISWAGQSRSRTVPYWLEYRSNTFEARWTRPLIQPRNLKSRQVVIKISPS